MVARDDAAGGESPERRPLHKIGHGSDSTTLGKIQQVSKRIAKVQIRDWNEFCLIGRFRAPKKDGNLITRRFVLNLVYFQANYAIIFLMAIFFVCIANPAFILALAQVLGVAHYVYKHRDDRADDEPTALRHRAVLSLSLCLLAYMGGPSLISALALSAIAVLGHSIGRLPTSKSPSYTMQDLWMREESIGALIVGPPIKELDLEDPVADGADSEGDIVPNMKPQAKTKRV